jgi:hypothetical protein
LDGNANGDDEMQRRQVRLELERKYQARGKPAAGARRAAAGEAAARRDHERQLEEVMADFWFNHFKRLRGQGARKAAAAGVRARRDPQARSRALRGLLLATAKSPAMLFYLDNWLSADPNAAKRIADRRAQRQRRRGDDEMMARPPQGPRRAGLNETTPARSSSCTHSASTGLHAEGRQRGRALLHRLDDRGLRDEPRFAFAAMLHDPATSSCWARRSSRRHDEGSR